MSETKMFDIVDLLWGTLNNFKDTLASNSGDPRREDGRNFLNAGLRRTFGRNTLKDVNGFHGIIFGALDTYQVDAAQKAGLLRDYMQNPGESPTALRTAYKVYIPEIEPSPAPKSASDPILWFYPNIFANDRVSMTQQLSVGDIVRVKYRDMQNLLEPTIVSKEGTISLSFPSATTGGLRFKFKATPTIVRPGGSGPPTPQPADVGPAAMNRGPKLTAAQLKPIRHLFMPILDAISKAESRTNSYDAGNRPAGHADGNYKGIKMTEKLFPGRDIATVTLQEIRNQMSAKQLFASGRYQIVPDTFDDHLGYTGLKLTDFYNPVNQDLFGIELLLHRRGRAGNYLAGKTEDVFGAGESLSYEWAGLPVQWDGQKQHSYVHRGGSYYDGDSINNAHAKPDAIIAALRETRANLDGSPEAQALFK
jgi:muramidase (phage lysozyme)